MSYRYDRTATLIRLHRLDPRSTPWGVVERAASLQPTGRSPWLSHDGYDGLAASVPAVALCHLRTYKMGTVVPCDLAGSLYAVGVYVHMHSPAAEASSELERVLDLVDVALPCLPSDDPRGVKAALVRDLYHATAATWFSL